MLQLSRPELATLITRGHLLVLHRRRVYRLNSWSASHPGGVLSILHFVGRDASDELEAYHDDTIQETFKRFQVAEIEEKSWDEVKGWKPLNPPLEAHVGWDNLPLDIWTHTESWQDGLAALGRRASKCSSSKECVQLPRVKPEQLEPLPSMLDPAQQYAMSLEWGRLHERVKAQGLYDPTPFSNYRFELLRYTLFLTLALAFYFYGYKTCQPALCALRTELTYSDQGISSPAPCSSASGNIKSRLLFMMPVTAESLETLHSIARWLVLLPASVAVCRPSGGAMYVPCLQAHSGI